MALRVVPAVFVGVVLLTLAACHSNPGTPSGGTTDSSSSPSASPSETGVDGGGPGIPQACTRDDLTITYAATDNTAGHAHGILTMTNSGTESCGMAGYPVLFMGSSEVAEPVGQQASPDGPAGSGFVITPGQAATSAVTITNAGFVDGCDVVQTTHFVAAPPQDDPFDWQSSGRNVPIAATDSCNEANIGLLTVGALQPA